MPMKEQYEIEYARFFNFPVSAVAVSSSTRFINGDDDGSSFPMMRPLSKFRKRRLKGGTWLSSSSSSSASLHLYFYSTRLILVIDIHHKICEEHFVSNLQFTWPQVSSVSQCPNRGSRIVFASYKDRVGQIQKFAISFLNSSESQMFISYLKESLNDERNILIPNSHFGSENLYQNELISANTVHPSTDKELSDVYLSECYPPLIESSLNNGVQYTRSEEITNDHDSEGIYTPLPESFTEFLAGNCIEAQEEPPVLVHKEVDLNTRITKYMSASSFNDMLIKLENAINDMGGGLAL